MLRGNEVSNLYVSLIEKVASGKVNYLDFGMEDFQFYRREIHTIKIIGDNSGIFSSEVARKIGVTRAVIHKILLKLEDRGFIEKIEDSNDKKIKKLFLSEKGRLAYKLHEEYHDRHDKEFFQYVENLSEEESQAIEKFLILANEMIEKHF